MRHYTYFDMVVGIQQYVCRLQVQMEQWWVHAVQEVHAHCSLVDNTETQHPWQWLGGQQCLQRACLHVLHHQAQWVTADAIYRQDVAELRCLHFIGLFKELGTLSLNGGVGGWTSNHEINGVL